MRAERSGTGDGRVYVLAFTATDSGGASCIGEVRVCVPHDPRRDCVLGPLLRDATQCMDQPRPHPRPWWLGWWHWWQKHR